jgi:hypothetical protein
VIDRGTSLTLIAVGLGFLYFAWLFSATGIFVANRGQVLTAAENPSQFSFALGVVLVLGAASLIGGLLAVLWPRR